MHNVTVTSRLALVSCELLIDTFYIAPVHEVWHGAVDGIIQIFWQSTDRLTSGSGISNDHQRLGKTDLLIFVKQFSTHFHKFEIEVYSGEPNNHSKIFVSSHPSIAPETLSYP